MDNNTQERIKADAEDYALPMVWVNQNPKGEEQLFYEYISSTSYIAGATAEHDRAQGELKEAQDAARMFCNKHNETATQLAEVVDRSKALVDALEAIAGITMPVPNKADMIEIAKKHLEQWKGGNEMEAVCACSLSHLAAHGECYKCPGRHTRNKLTNPQK